MYIVILAGGSGTRFWPVSKASRPKQLISITGDTTMLQRTVERVLPLKPKRILIVTNHIQAEETIRQVSCYTQTPIDVIPEPVARNTAAAIGLAATIIAAHDSRAIMAVLPADHFIKNETILLETLTYSAGAAANGYLVTLGIMPSRPETGYGYIEADMNLRGAGPFPVKHFVEKPALETAISYLEAGNFFWNSGMFIWRADTILMEISRYMVELSKSLKEISFTADVWELHDLKQQIEKMYNTVANVSIDYGVMEKSDKVQVVPVEMGWSDVGSWSALPEVVAADANGTVAINVCEHISINSKNCIVYGNGQTIATVGLDDLIVVATDDAILVCHRDAAQDVKKVVEELAYRGATTTIS